MKLNILVEREDGAYIRTVAEGISHDDLIHEIRTQFGAPGPGRPGEQIAVVRVADGATWERNKWREEQFFEPGDIFYGGHALSRALGTATNAVGMALKRAKAEGEVEATIRGVTFRTLDSI